MADITVKQQQWLGDIALEACGSFEDIFALAAANDLSITDDLDTGELLASSDILDQSIVDYYSVNEIFPATALAPVQAAQGGIGYMEIGVDFKVS